jgi:hypothetical protein
MSSAPIAMFFASRTKSTELTPRPRPCEPIESRQAELDALRIRDTREGDAIAAARRRLPIVEVDGTTPLIGEATCHRRFLCFLFVPCSR